MNSRELSDLSSGDLLVVTIERGGGMRTLGAEVLSVHCIVPPGPRGRVGKDGKMRLRIFDANIYTVRSFTKTLTLQQSGVIGVDSRLAEIRLPNDQERETIHKLRKSTED